MSDDVLFHRVRIRLDEPSLDDVAGETDRTLADCGVDLEPGSEVAITIGSRGISDLTTVVARIVAWVRAQGAIPFLVPAMGSHGGATAEGQRDVLAAYGFVDGWEGCEVRSSMDVVPVAGEHDLPVPIVTDAHAAAAAATIVVNRVKQHTDFHGPYESGLMKMAAIGLGKRVQAEALHAHGTRGLRELMPLVAEHVLAHGNIVARRRDRRATRWTGRCSCGRCRPPTSRPWRRRCSTWPGRTPRGCRSTTSTCCSIDRMGKDISGVGIDTNVIGRTMIAGEPDPVSPRIRMIGCHSLTPASHGNATGMGLADVDHPPTRRRHRPRHHPDQHRDVRLPAARQAPGGRRRRPARLGAVPPRRRCDRPDHGPRGTDHRHPPLHRAVGDRRGVGRPRGARRTSRSSNAAVPLHDPTGRLRPFAG